ncbi:MAG: ABC transporter permease [Acidimicrobiia bacterium]
MSERPRDVVLIWHQIRYQNKIFWRTPISAFFTLVFPLMFLVLFTAIFGNDVSQGTDLHFAQFYAPGLAVFAAVSASYTNLGIGTAIARDNGILKRVRGTPLPPWIYIAGRIGSAIWIAFLAVLMMLVVGVVFYGVQIPVRGLLAAVVAFLVGVACFSALGMLVAALAPNGDSTPAITNATLLPVAFVSDVFIRIDNPPAWMDFVGKFFPLRPFVESFRDALDPTLTGSQFHWGQLGYMALWGVVAVVIAVRFFRWEPKVSSETPPRRRRRARSAAG